MSNIDYSDVEPEKFEIRACLSRCGQTLSELFLIVVGLTLVAEVLGFIGDTLGPVGNSFMAIVAAIIGFATQGAVAWAIVKKYQNEEVTFKDSLVKGLSRLPSVILTILLSFLLMMGALIPVGIFLAVVIPMTKSALVIILGGLALGALLLWVVTIVSLAVPACVVENLGGLDSLRRSRELTKDNRLKIMLVYLLAFVLMAGLAVGGVFVVGSMFAVNGLSSLRELLNFASASMENGFNATSLVFYLALFLLSTISRVVYNVVCGSIYLELLIVKADKDLEEMSEVFE
ncbi:MAG: hypothetical protein LBT86_03450 [Deltaproteobacteria bacterium]|jgi:hypothetical protein|nr:hypothetical protein [Deltaproteobacteria bacterium]